MCVFNNAMKQRLFCVCMYERPRKTCVHQHTEQRTTCMYVYVHVVIVFGRLCVGVDIT